MITWASVDLPDPLGPITACTWPLSTSRSTPRRISWPPTAARRPETTSSLTCAPPSAAARERAALHIGSLADARSRDVHDHVAVLDPNLVHGNGLRRRQRLGLAGLEREGAAVLPALDLPFVLPDLAVGERVVLVAAAVVDGIHVVAEAHHAHPDATYLEASGRAGLDFVEPAEARRRRRHAPPPRRTAKRSRSRVASESDGSRSSTSEKNPSTMSRSATSGGTPRLSR